MPRAIEVPRNAYVVIKRHWNPTVIEQEPIPSLASPTVPLKLPPEID
jgi:hypothetical protein